MTLHRYIDRDLQMTPIDFQVTRSEVKVTVTKVVFTQWLPVQRTAHMGGMHVLQTALVIILFLKYRPTIAPKNPFPRFFFLHFFRFFGR